MSQYPECKHGDSDPNFECKRCNTENRVSELEAMCAELKNALAEANDYDAAAEGENSANFRHKRKEFDELATRAGRMLSNEKGQP